ncbi:MAG: hypothetical protein WC556_05395 [Candidatus Methanoperedens sp.]
METIEAIKSRRSICGFTDENVDDETVTSILDASDSFELMAVVAMGHPASRPRIPERKKLGQLVFCEKFGKSW